MTDSELLHRWVTAREEAAFTHIVTRHAGLVWGTALRRCAGDAMLAQEASQRVFTALARKACGLLRHPSLPGWLHRATLLESASLARRESCHARKLAQLAQASAAMNDIPFPEDESALHEEIDAALERLSMADRHILLMRFYEGHSFADIGMALGKSADTAQKRSARALERLARHFRHPMQAPMALLAVAMGTSFRAEAAPSMVAQLSSTAISQAAALGPGATLYQTLQLMIYNKSATLGAAALLLLLGSSYTSHSLGQSSLQASATPPRDLLGIFAAPSGKSLAQSSTLPERRSMRSLKSILTDIAALIGVTDQGITIMMMGTREAYRHGAALTEFDVSQVNAALALLPEFSERPGEFDNVATFLSVFLCESMSPEGALKTMLKPEHSLAGRPSEPALKLLLENWARHDPVGAWQQARVLGEQGVVSTSGSYSAAVGVMRVWLGSSPDEALRALTALPASADPSGQPALGQVLSCLGKEAVIKALRKADEDRVALLVADSRPEGGDWIRDEVLSWIIERPWQDAKSRTRALQKWAFHEGEFDHDRLLMLCELAGRCKSVGANEVVADYLVKIFREAEDIKKGSVPLEQFFKDPAQRAVFFKSLTSDL